MKRRLFLWALALPALLFLASCEEDYPEFDGEPAVEFKNHYVDRVAFPVNTSLIRGLSSTTARQDVNLTRRHVSDALPADSILVQLVGAPRSSPTTVNYTLSGSAVQGVNYNIVGVTGNTGTVTIPAGSNFGWIQVRPINQALGAGVVVELVVTMTGASGVRVNPNYDQFFYRIGDTPPPF